MVRCAGWPGWLTWVRACVRAQMLDRVFKQPQLTGRSLFVLGPHNRFRLLCSRLIHNKCVPLSRYGV